MLQALGPGLAVASLGMGRGHPRLLQPCQKSWAALPRLGAATAPGPGVIQTRGLYPVGSSWDLGVMLLGAASWGHRLLTAPSAGWFWFIRLLPGKPLQNEPDFEDNGDLRAKQSWERRVSHAHTSSPWLLGVPATLQQDGCPSPIHSEVLGSC